MFQITQYLQFRNTPDGKPRVLNQSDSLGQNTYYFTGMKSLTQLMQDESTRPVANLQDCRPLLRVEIDGVELRSLTVRNSKEYPGVYQFLYFDGSSWNLAESYITANLNNRFLSYVVEDNLYLFESDPAKYSKLLWNCSEEEGWKKIFELLDIKL